MRPKYHICADRELRFALHDSHPDINLPVVLGGANIGPLPGVALLGALVVFAVGERQRRDALGNQVAPVDMGKALNKPDFAEYSGLQVVNWAG